MPSSSRFDELLLLYPEAFRPFIMNIAERHSMYGTRTEAQGLYEETHVAAELVEVLFFDEPGWYTWTFIQRGYGMTVPTDYLVEMAMSGKMVIRGEKHEEGPAVQDELLPDSGGVGRKLDVRGGDPRKPGLPDEGIPYP